MASVILDSYGRPIETPKRPDEGRVAMMSVRDRWATYPSRGLTPQRLASILQVADEGDVARQAELFQEMEEKDCHLASVLGTRKGAVLSLPWSVQAASDDTADVKAAELVEEAIELAVVKPSAVRASRAFPLSVTEGSEAQGGVKRWSAVAPSGAASTSAS